MSLQELENVPQTSWWRHAAWALTGFVVGLSLRWLLRDNAPGRWEWWFSSPNDLGPLAAGWGTAALAACAVVARRPAWPWRLATALCGLLALAGLMGSLGSASRAGMVTLVLCTVCVWWTVPRDRRHWDSAWIALTLGALICDPQATVRATTMVSQAATDASISHRREIWGAALVMLNDVPTPRTGPAFLDIYTRWYEPTPRGALVWHPLNDTLLIVADYGWLWGLGYAALIGGAVCAAVTAAVRSRLVGAICVACGALAVGMGGITSALLRRDGAGWWVVAILAVTVVYLVVRHRERSVAWAGTIGMLVGVLAVAAAAGVGHVWAASWPVQADPINPRAVVWPRGRAGQAGSTPSRCVVVIDAVSDLSGYGRGLARGLAAAGSRVELRLASEPPDEPIDILVLTRGVAEWSDPWRAHAARASAVILLDPLPGLRGTCPGPRGLIIGARSTRAEPTWSLVQLDTPRIWMDQAGAAVEPLLRWLHEVQPMGGAQEPSAQR